MMKSDIFFFISSVATVLLTLLMATLLWYVIRAARNLYKLSEALKSGFKESEEFVTELRERLENNMVFQLFFPLPRRKRRISEKHDIIKPL